MLQPHVYISIVEHRGRVVNIPASYWEGPEFKSPPGDRLPWLRAFVVLPVPSGECQDSTFKLNHGCFLPNPFQFVIHLSSYLSTLYDLSH
jgi:hypothetical protein